MSKQLPTYMSIKSYAEECGVGVHAIYMRLKKSEDNIYRPGDESYLDVEINPVANGISIQGVFINTTKFPPVKIKKGPKFKNKK